LAPRHERGQLLALLEPGVMSELIPLVAIKRTSIKLVLRRECQLG
jgi:hypothetical protein